MRWTIKIESKPELQIVVSFNPLLEKIDFIGQYKPKNREWVDFSNETYSMDIDLENIKSLLYKTYNKMKIRLEAYENISKGFEHIKLIEINDGDNNKSNIII